VRAAETHAPPPDAPLLANYASFYPTLRQRQSIVAAVAPSYSSDSRVDWQRAGELNAAFLLDYDEVRESTINCAADLTGVSGAVVTTSGVMASFTRMEFSVRPRVVVPKPAKNSNNAPACHCDQDPGRLTHEVSVMSIRIHVDGSDVLRQHKGRSRSCALLTRPAAAREPDCGSA
jgi:hypothetical protein